MSILPVSILPVSILPVSMLPVSILAVSILAVSILAWPATAAAQAPAFTDPDWLPAGSRLQPDEVPPERLTIAAGAHGLAELGRLAYRSPDILGGNARLSEISCQICHPNGGANRAFFIPGLSDRPGRVDVAHRLWNPMADDGIDRPLEIPVLHGLADRDHVGGVLRMASLRDFTRRVITVEFAGPEPNPLVLDGLVEYLLALAAEDAPAASVLERGEGIADLPRYLAVMDRALAAEDAALAEQVSRMIRGALGRMARKDTASSREQMAGTELAGTELAGVGPEPTAPEPFAGWARQVAAIARDGEAGRFAAARAAIGDLQTRIAPYLP